MGENVASMPIASSQGMQGVRSCEMASHGKQLPELVLMMSMVLAAESIPVSICQATSTVGLIFQPHGRQQRGHIVLI